MELTKTVSSQRLRLSNLESNHVVSALHNESELRYVQAQYQSVPTPRFAILSELPPLSYKPLLIASPPHLRARARPDSVLSPEFHYDTSIQTASAAPRQRQFGGLVDRPNPRRDAARSDTRNLPETTSYSMTNTHGRLGYPGCQPHGSSLLGGRCSCGGCPRARRSGRSLRSTFDCLGLEGPGERAAGAETGAGACAGVGRVWGVSMAARTGWGCCRLCPRGACAYWSAAVRWWMGPVCPSQRRADIVSVLGTGAQAGIGTTGPRSLSRSSRCLPRACRWGWAVQSRIALGRKTVIAAAWADFGLI